MPRLNLLAAVAAIGLFAPALFAPAPAVAATPAAAAPAKPAAAPAAAAPAAAPAKARYSTADTEIGTLLDDPAAKALLEKVIPGMTTNDQIDMARSMTLKAIQAYAPEQITDERLAQLDAEFAKLGQ